MGLWMRRSYSEFCGKKEKDTASKILKLSNFDFGDKTQFLKVTIQKSDSTILDSNLALKYSGQSL
jgi:hypothetical protein